jgi:hypothetical protein
MLGASFIWKDTTSRRDEAALPWNCSEMPADKAPPCHGIAVKCLLIKLLDHMVSLGSSSKIIGYYQRRFLPSLLQLLQWLY